MAEEFLAHGDGRVCEPRHKHLSPNERACSLMSACKFVEGLTIFVRNSMPCFRSRSRVTSRSATRTLGNDETGASGVGTSSVMSGLSGVPGPSEFMMIHELAALRSEGFSCETTFASSRRLQSSLDRATSETTTKCVSRSPSSGTGKSLRSMYSHSRRGIQLARAVDELGRMSVRPSVSLDRRSSDSRCGAWSSCASSTEPS